MKSTEANKNNLEGLLHALDGEPLVRIAILFGSFGTNYEKPESDVDIAIGGSTPLTTDQKLNILSLVETSTRRTVDLIDLQTATGTVFKEALSKGRILINHDTDLMGRLLIRMLSEAADFQIRKRALAAEAQERIFRVEGRTKSKA
jgi:uncharacterized protein